MVNQLNGEYQVKEPILQRCVEKIGLIKEKFKKLEFAYILGEENDRDDLLSMLSNIEEHDGWRMLSIKQNMLQGL